VRALRRFYGLNECVVRPLDLPHLVQVCQRSPRMWSACGVEQQRLIRRTERRTDAARHVRQRQPDQPAGLMRHEHRHRRVMQDRARDAAENQLAQARVAVRAHDQQIAGLIGDVREDDVGDVDLPRLEISAALDLGQNASKQKTLVLSC
jgi:hypothetical protein